MRRFEDRDEPVTPGGPKRRLEFFEVKRAIQDDSPDPGLTMAAAVGTYLALRREEVDDGPGDGSRLAARAEFGRHVPDDVAAWLAVRRVRA